MPKESKFIFIKKGGLQTLLLPQLLPWKSEGVTRPIFEDFTIAINSLIVNGTIFNKIILSGMPSPKSKNLANSSKTWQNFSKTEQKTDMLKNM